MLKTIYVVLRVVLGSYLSAKTNGMVVRCVENILRTQKLTNAIFSILIPMKSPLTILKTLKKSSFFSFQNRVFWQLLQKNLYVLRENEEHFKGGPSIDMQPPKRIMVVSLLVFEL